MKDVKTIIGNKYLKISELKKHIKYIEEEGINSGFTNENLIALKQHALKLRSIYRSKQVELVEIGSGKMCLSGKPSVAKLEELQAQGLDVVVTLLKANEFDDAFKKFFEESEITWVWVPLSASKLLVDDDFVSHISGAYKRMKEALESGKHICVHCAAGVHRTGSFTNGFLRYIGFSKEESKELIYQMRPITAIEAVRKHWKWSEKIISLF